FSRGDDVFLAKSDGSDARKLATLGGLPFALRFSPDGVHVRFSVFDRNSGSNSLWEVARDGGSPRRLLAEWHQDPGECCGAWTPDGKYFLFNAFRQGRGGIWALQEKAGLL